MSFEVQVLRGVVLVVVLLSLLLVGLLVVWLYFSGRVSGRSSPFVVCPWGSCVH